MVYGYHLKIAQTIYKIYKLFSPFIDCSVFLRIKNKNEINIKEHNYKGKSDRV